MAEQLCFNYLFSVWRAIHFSNGPVVSYRFKAYVSAPDHVWEGIAWGLAQGFLKPSAFGDSDSYLYTERAHAAFTAILAFEGWQ